MIAPVSALDDETRTMLRDQDPVVRRYRALAAVWPPPLTHTTAMSCSPTIRSRSTRWTPPTITRSTSVRSPCWGGRPTNVIADATFDAWHIYETCAPGGLAAISLNTRGHPAPQRRPDGAPLCPTGLAMSPSYRCTHTEGYRAQEFRCPLLHPHPSGQTCAHEQFAKGPGCVKYINFEPGGLMCALLDRGFAPYKDLYRQRTAAERINGQATALGIERPKVRNARSVHTLNTLTYIIINVQALARVRLAKAPAPPLTAALC